MTKETLEALLGRLDAWIVACGVVIAIGAVGVAVFGYIHHQRARDLVRLQNTENQELTLRIAEAESRIAEANRRAEEERLARVRIEERLATRHVSPEQYREFVAILSPFRGSIVDLTKLGDFEAGNFADDIIRVLRDFGWNVRESFMGMVSPPRYGLDCAVNNTIPAGAALARVVTSLPTGQVRTMMSAPVIANIFVGLRPPP